MNLYEDIKNNLKEAWDISFDERTRMYNFIVQVYGERYAERAIDNLGTVTDEKINRIYNSALKKFKKAQKVKEPEGDSLEKELEYDMEREKNPVNALDKTDAHNDVGYDKSQIAKRDGRK